MDLIGEVVSGKEGHHVLNEYSNDLGNNTWSHDVGDLPQPCGEPSVEVVPSAEFAIYAWLTVSQVGRALFPVMRISVVLLSSDSWVVNLVKVDVSTLLEFKVVHL